MDLCTRCATTEETFEYRHKKFDHVRASTPAFKEEVRSTAGTPYSLISNSTYRNNVNEELEENDTTWEPSTDDFELPRTPTNRRVQYRYSRNKRNASYELCNAPKKCKSAQYVAHVTTPEKCTKRVRTTPSLMPEISKEALARICQYNKNMVRKFPKKQRTAKDQERRDKNTIACRMSRRLKKLENLAVEEQHKIFTQEYLEQYKRTMHATVYLNELIKFGGKVTTDGPNVRITESIAKKLGLHYLESILTSAGPKEINLNNQNPHQVECNEVKVLPKRDIDEIPVMEDKLNTQRKIKFSISFLLGKQ